jgi:uncharacterized protein YbbC (DUF1343 family)
MTDVMPGLATLLAERRGALDGVRVGLATHPAAVLPNLTHATQALLEAGVHVTALFGPEHGLAGAAEAGDHIGHGRDARTGIPVYSLYGEHMRPSAAQLADVDLVLFDMQDVGARFYTYASTLRELLHATADAGLPLWVLDRPNPLGGAAVEGPLLQPGFESFVGAAPVPVRHGLTLGELARLLQAYERPDARLEVVPLGGWRRRQRFERTGLAWVAPSPNMPHLSTALVYPGMCLLEGANLSCGRGTTLPFEVCGAPWVDPFELAARLNAARLPGVRFRAARFTPLADRFAGQQCGGVQVHVVDADALRPVALGVHVVSALRRCYPDDFAWHTAHFDRLAGSAELRAAIEAGEAADGIAAAWEPGCRAFRRQRRAFLLYR